MSINSTVGFYGKFPELGDFVNRRLPRSFLDPWDEWLQNAIATSRQQLGDEWLNLYLTSPIWHFVLGGGLCGEAPWCGLLMPSVDRVGRYYPLIVATPLPLDVNLFHIAVEGESWFAAADEIILSALDEQDFSLESFDRKVSELGGLKELAEYGAESTHIGYGNAWRIGLGGDGKIDGAMPRLMHHLMLQRFGSYSLWWGAGSSHVSPSLLIAEGMPPASDFAAMLNGDWTASAWENWPLISADELEQGNELVEPGSGL
ncbi:MAG: type VI secretion system-associated protein TagF [Gammaproteobacteria bacterium]